MKFEMRFGSIGVLLALLLVFSFNGRAQSKKSIEDILSVHQLEKYKKGEALIVKGRMVIAMSDSTERSDTKQFQREKKMKEEQANITIRDGLNIKMKVLEQYIKGIRGNISNEKIAEKYDGLLVRVEKGRKKAGKIFSQSKKTPNLAKTVKYQEDAIREQENIIAEVEKGLLEADSLMNAVPAEPLAEKTDTAKVEEKQVVEAKPETVEVKQEVTPETAATVAAAVVAGEVAEQAVKTGEKKEVKPEPQPASGVYFTIQIMADKVRVSESRLKRVYTGSREIIENAGDGWYRYSVGRFNSYSEAAAAMKKEGIKGYVVAYNGSKRITTAAAKKILGGNK